MTSNKSSNENYKHKCIAQITAFKSASNKKRVDAYDKLN